MHKQKARVDPVRAFAFTGGRQSIADRAAARLLPFGRCRPAFFHTVAIGLLRPPVLLFRRVQSPAERRHGYPPTFVENGGALLACPRGLREWGHVPAQKSRRR